MNWNLFNKYSDIKRIMWLIQKSWHNLIMDIHNSIMTIMDIHNWIMDIHDYRVYALLAFHREYNLYICTQVNVTEPHRWWVNIGLDNGLVPSGNKPKHEVIVTIRSIRY